VSDFQVPDVAADTFGPTIVLRSTPAVHFPRAAKPAETFQKGDDARLKTSLERILNGEGKPFDVGVLSIQSGRHGIHNSIEGAAGLFARTNGTTSRVTGVRDNASFYGIAGNDAIQNHVRLLTASNAIASLDPLPGNLRVINRLKMSLDSIVISNLFHEGRREKALEPGKSVPPEVAIDCIEPKPRRYAGR